MSLPAIADIPRLSDSELLAILDAHNQYSDRVIDAVEDEIERRGGLEKLIEQRERSGDASKWNGLTEAQIGRALRWGMVPPIIAGILALGLVLFEIIDANNHGISNGGLSKVFAVLLIGLALVGVGYGVRKGSLACAIIGLILWTFEFTSAMVINPISIFTLLCGLLLYGSFRGVRGTLAHRKMRKDLFTSRARELPA